MATTTTVSASDPSITYSPQGAWAHVAGIMYTFENNVTAELSFTGEFVEVYGTISPGGHGVSRPVSTYILDGNSTSLVVFNSSNTSSRGTPFYPFYQSPQLVDGNHTLLISSTEDQTSFTLDSIVYGSSNPNSNSTLPPPSGTEEGPLSIASASSTSSVLSLSSPTANSDVSSSTFKLSVGGIVGGIIAALILLAGLIAWLLIRRRMNRRTEKHRTVTPFIASRNESRASDRMLLSPVVPQYIDEKASLPPPFVPSPAAVAAQRGSMYKPGGSDVLPPMEFGYGGGV